ncbi:MAG: hypothetical protein U1F28_05255 [Acinetobacter sp.]
MLGPYETRIYEFDAKLLTDAESMENKIYRHQLWDSAISQRFTLDTMSTSEITLPVDKGQSKT